MAVPATSGRLRIAAYWVTATELGATSTMAAAYGGTGISTLPGYGQILVGNNTGGYTLTGTGSLGLLSPIDIGVSVQAYSANLGTLAGLTSTAGNFIVGSAGNVWETQATGTVRSTLGLTNAYTYRDYFIDGAGTWGQLWMADGANQGQWRSTSTLGLLTVDSTLDDVKDVAVSGAVRGDLLSWNGSNWVNAATSSSKSPSPTPPAPSRSTAAAPGSPACPRATSWPASPLPLSRLPAVSISPPTRRWGSAHPPRPKPSRSPATAISRPPRCATRTTGVTMGSGVQ